MIIIDPGQSFSFDAHQIFEIDEKRNHKLKFEWKLQGKGKLHPKAGQKVVYKSPNSGDSLAIISVSMKAKGARNNSVYFIVQTSPVKFPISNLGIPVGWMRKSRKGDPTEFIETGKGAGREEGTVSDWFTFEKGGEWGSVIWWPDECGDKGSNEDWKRVESGQCKKNLLEVGGFTEITSLTFWARGKKGNEVIKFKVGDTRLFPEGKSEKDVVLSSDWKQITINVEHLDLSKAVALFSWFVADNWNEDSQITFYLQDIQFEGVGKK